LKNISGKLNKAWLFLIVVAAILFGLYILSAKQAPKKTENKDESETIYSKCPLTNDTDQIQIEETGLKTNTRIGIVDFGKDTIEGVKKDGIPAIKSPKFITSELASECIRDDEEVFVISVNGVSKVYPEKILNWHEVVNDEFRDEAGVTTPIVLTYSPLTNTASAFVRKIEGKEVQFGMSGRVWQNIPLLYDDNTESLWVQLNGNAIIGDSTGKALEQIQVERKLYKDVPGDLEVLSFDTGFVRNYDVDPYASYRGTKELYYPGQEISDKLENKDFVVGIVINGKAKAYPIGSVDGELEDEFEGQKIKVIQNSTVDYNVVKLSDKEVSEPVYSVISYWYAWNAAYPETLVYEQ
jgi:hypothetical protein